MGEGPIFVTGDTAAERCQVSRDTWDAWVRTGYVPPAAIDRGQILRWHWPSVEARLAGNLETAEVDPFVQGVRNAKKTREARQKRGAGRVAA